jgi:hypothetical protein
MPAAPDSRPREPRLEPASPAEAPRGPPRRPGGAVRNPPNEALRPAATLDLFSKNAVGARARSGSLENEGVSAHADTPVFAKEDVARAARAAFFQKKQSRHVPARARRKKAGICQLRQPTIGGKKSSVGGGGEGRAPNGRCGTSGLGHCRRKSRCVAGPRAERAEDRPGIIRAELFMPRKASPISARPIFETKSSLKFRPGPFCGRSRLAEACRGGDRAETRQKFFGGARFAAHRGLAGWAGGAEGREQRSGAIRAELSTCNTGSPISARPKLL